MCGIAAIYGYRADAPDVDLAELRAIGEHLARRGPDGQGEWLSTPPRVGLAHRRLAVIDLSERGAQPMVVRDGSLAVTFNGEIYNHVEHRSRLEARGYRFQSTCDAEVLLALYAERGAEMVRDLRGMFAFALWDARRRQLVLARDPYGIKPLYYSDDGSTLRVASQVKALLAGGRVSRALDPAGVAGFYVFGSVPEPITIRRDVRCLEAGSTMVVSAQGPEASVRYHSIASVLASAHAEGCRVPANGQASREKLAREAIRDSVRHHLVADVPVGAFLSAGVDSATLVCLMSELGQQDMRTVTLGFEEFRGTGQDEVPLAEELAGRLGTRHQSHVVTEGELRRALPRILRAMDQPSVDGLNSWLVSKAAREHGLKVAVSGVGGDELFGGYPSFRQVPAAVAALRLPSKIPWLGEVVRRLWGPLAMRRPGWSPKIGGTLLLGGSYPGAYLLRRGLFLPWELDTLMGKEAALEGLARLRPLDLVAARLSPDPGTAFARVACLESSLYLRNQLLRDTDWASMDHGLEVRVPLVDARLLERLAPLLVAVKQVPDKALLARSLRSAPRRSLVRRKKTGFGLPLQLWIARAGGELGTWRKVPLLARENCRWARRIAYALVQHAAQE